MRGGAWTVAAAGALGAAALAALLPRLDAVVAEFQPHIGRAEAIEAARRIAGEYGENLSGWRFGVATRVDSRRLLAWRSFRDSAMVQRHNPLTMIVVADDRAGDAVQVTLGADGKLVRYAGRFRMSRMGGGGEWDPERELARYAGAEAASFRRTANGVRTAEGLRNAWERLDKQRPGVLERVEVVTNGGHVVRSGLDLEIAQSLVDSLGDRWAVLRVAQVILIAIVVLTLLVAALWAFFSSLTRRHDHVLFGARFLWIPGVALVLVLLTGSYRDQALVGGFEGGTAGETHMLQGAAVGTFLLLLVLLLVGAGYTQLPRTERWRWVGAALAGRGQLWAREVGREVFLGLMAGIGLAALPYLVGAAAGKDAPPVRLLDGGNLLVESYPAVRPLDGLAYGWEACLIAGFLLPWLSSKIRRRGPRWLAAVALGGIYLTVARDAFAGGHPLNIVPAVLMAAGYLGIYQSAGLLGTWMAPVGFYSAVEGGRLMALGTTAFHQSGWHVAGVFGALAASALVVWRFGREDNGAAVLEEMEAGATALPKPERERLMAEFGVARRAQQGMLPLTAPELKGMEVSAICEPAREVGGDLFDYLHFEDGQCGVCVADVSGKGVPAALYMTLTKGMLASAEMREADLAGIATRLNRALAETGRKRVFVTMSLGVLDPEKRLFRHVRAGHNPPVLWRAGTGECMFLKPHGIGLGMTAGPAFERNLEEQDVWLDEGDVLVLYSDGLVECMNERQEQFGEERLVEAIREGAGLSAERLRDLIVNEARVFRGAADPHDDLTVMVLRAHRNSRVNSSDPLP